MKPVEIDIRVEEELRTFSKNGVRRPVRVDIVKAVFGDEVARAEESSSRDDGVASRSVRGRMSRYVESAVWLWSSEWPEPLDIQEGMGVETEVPGKMENGSKVGSE